MNARLVQILLLLLACWFMTSPALFATARAGRGRAVFLAFLLGSVFVAAGLFLRYGIIDDSYISLRYARNFARGAGLVYNPGERVEGYTSFLWVVLLGTWQRLTGADPVRTCVTGGVLFGLLTLGLTAVLLRGRSRLLIGRAPFVLFLVFSIPCLFWSFSGMETSLFTSLLLLATWTLFRAWRDPERGFQRLFLAGLLFGLASLARPETWLYAAVTGMLVLSQATPGRRLREGSGFALGFLVLAGGHLIFRLSYYGDPLPNTYYVKVGGGSAALAAYGLHYLMRGAIWHWPLLILAALGAVRPGSGETPEERRERIFSISLLGAQAAAVIYTGADHFREMRFFFPMLPFLVLLAARGMSSVIDLLHLPAPRARAWAAHGAVLAAVSATLLLSFFHGRVGYDSSLVFGKAITQRWALIGEWLRSQAGPEDLLATPVAGAVAYTSDLPTLDMLGLTDRTIAHEPTKLGGEAFKDHEKYDTDYVLSRRPAWIFLGHFQVRDLADYLRRPAMPACAEIARRLPLPGYELLSGQYRGIGFTFLHRTEGP